MSTFPSPLESTGRHNPVENVHFQLPFSLLREHSSSYYTSIPCIDLCIPSSGAVDDTWVLSAELRNNLSPELMGNLSCELSESVIISSFEETIVDDIDQLNEQLGFHEVTSHVDRDYYHIYKEIEFLSETYSAEY